MRKNEVLRKIIVKNSPFFAIAVILSFILSELVVVGSGLISDSVNVLTIGGSVDMRSLSLEMGIIILISMAMSYTRSICNELFSINVQKQCKNMTMEAIEKADYSFFNDNAGTVINKLTSDIGDMGNLLSEILPDILKYAVNIIVISFAIMRMNWIIFVGVLVVFPTSIFISNRIAERINALAKKRRGKYDELSNIALDNIEGIEIAKAYGLEDILGKRVNKKAHEILQNEYARNRYQALASGLMLFMKWVPTIICSIISLGLVLRNVITIGELMAFLVLLGKISDPISELPFRMIDAKEMMISVRRIQEIMNIEPEKSGVYEGGTEKSDSAVIELKNIAFSYNTESQTHILKDLDMVVEKGQKVAVVGASGAGKSTLIKLLCGFIRKSSGVYNFCGHDFEEWNIDKARSMMAYVSQNSYLFPGTIAENIAYGGDGIDMEKVEKACREAGIYGMVNELPERFNTEVGERGVKLSGGERQRLSIARAIYKDTPVILMDEPTSALDEETQALVSKVIYDGRDKTVIVIAHRLSTIKDADVIYCMDKGKITESGSHDELMAKSGAYAALYRKEAVQ